MLFVGDSMVQLLQQYEVLVTDKGGLGLRGLEILIQQHVILRGPDNSLFCSDVTTVLLLCPVSFPPHRPYKVSLVYLGPFAVLL